MSPSAYRLTCTRGTPLPLLGDCELRVVLGPGDGIENDTGDTAILTHILGWEAALDRSKVQVKVFGLAEVNNASLAQEALEGLGQDRAGLGAPGQVGVFSLQLGIQLANARRLLEAGEDGRIIVHRTARIHHDGGAGGLLVGETDFGHQPVEEGEDLVKGRHTIEIGGETLVDGAITETDIDRAALRAYVGLTLIP